MGRTVDLVEARVDPADRREADRDADRVDLDPVGRRQDRDRKNVRNNILKKHLEPSRVRASNSPTSLHGVIAMRHIGYLHSSPYDAGSELELAVL